MRSQAEYGDARLSDRMWARITPEPNTGCWLWTGGSSGGGYGVVRSGRRTLGVHQATYTAFVGEQPQGYHIDHLCRTPACCNPDHLEAVTHSENLRRGAGASVRRRLAALITHCPKGHEYTAENTMVRATATGTKRNCRACGRAQCERYRLRKRAAR